MIQMRAFGFLLVVVSVLSCRPENTNFNPFDKEFRFHSTFERAECDSTLGTCGYWNLTKKDGNLATYYQFYLDEKEIVAKGFDLYTDEFSIENSDSLLTSVEIDEIVNQHPLDLVAVKQSLKDFDIKEVRFQNPVVWFERIELVDTRDSIYLADIQSFVRGGKVVRRLTYFNGK